MSRMGNLQLISSVYIRFHTNKQTSGLSDISEQIGWQTRTTSHPNSADHTVFSTAMDHFQNRPYTGHKAEEVYKY